MRQVKVTLVSITPYSQSRQHEAPKLQGETGDAYEKRTWRDKCNAMKDGTIFLPAMALKQSLDAAAKKSGKQIPGKGKATYTKFFMADCICDENVPLGIKQQDVEVIRLPCSVDGKRGGTKRVWRMFPLIPSWTAEANFTVLDDTIDKQTFEEMLTLAGKSIGIGRFRPENGGLNGRFKPTKFQWN